MRTHVAGSAGQAHLVCRCLFSVGDGGVHHQQRKDEHEVRVVQQDDGQEGRHLHGPGQRVPHVPEPTAQKRSVATWGRHACRPVSQAPSGGQRAPKVNEECVPGALGKLVGAILQEPFLSLSCGQALLCHLRSQEHGDDSAGVLAEGHWEQCWVPGQASMRTRTPSTWKASSALRFLKSTFWTLPSATAATAAAAAASS